MPTQSRASDVNDLFISYSHIDNRPWGAGQRQWVSELHRELQTRLAQLVGRDVLVWRDEKIAGSDLFDDRIIAELRRSRVFLCVMTPRYLQSEWCRREIGVFLDEALVDRGDARRPFFKVIKTPIDLRDQPGPAQRFLGFEFFREVGEKFHELYPNRDENSVESREFWQKVDDLAQEMKTILLQEAPASDVPAATVYLAETTGDVRLARDGIRRELGQRGYRVLPDRSLPLDAGELLPALEADLKSATLTVHPVGSRYGVVPEGETRSLVELQIEAALHRNGHAQHLIWISPEAAGQVDARHQEFLDRLRRVYTEQHGTELLERIPLEELKTRLVDKLEPARASSASRGPAIPSGVRVYVVCDAADLPAVKPIEAHLRTLGCSVDLPLVEGTATEIREDHQATLELCDAVIIYYGAGRPAWLREKQRDLRKAPGWGRKRPFLAQAVCVGAPASEEKSAYTSDEFIVVRADAGFAPESLRPFFDVATAARKVS
jgi:TIR domain